MAIAKVILNGETQMDVTSNTNAANNMLNGVVGTKNDGTSVTGNIASKSSDDLTASGATVTAPAGYYANAASKAVATTTHPNPSASITSSTGVVTASHTQGTGYVTGGTTTGTLNLTTQAGKTVTPTETVQTAVASYRWTTGPISVAAISSTYVGTGITTRSAADMTVAGQSVTAPAGYYSQAFTKAVTTTTHPNPTATIVSSTGVVTATHTQTTGYVTSGTTTGTLNLTTQAAQTINTSTADQTIASNRWLTGAQTIKSVTTTNLTAANIAEGVVVKVGDANNASRITQITGTHSGATSYTATISGSGNSSYCYVTYGGTKRYTNGNTFTFKAGDTLTIYCRGNNASVNGDKLTLSSYSYTYTLPVGDITINLSYSSSTSNSIVIYGLIKPTGDLSITASGTHNTYKYSTATVAAGSAFPPAVTITKAPTIGVNTSGVVTASYNGSSSITPTVTSGYISQGTAGTISTTGTSTYQLTSEAAATYYPSTADQTIASQRWLVGNQTIKSVTTSNLTAANIAEGVVVKVGDSANASRITQITGTHKSGGYTCTITGSGNSATAAVQYRPSNGNTEWYYGAKTITYGKGDSFYISAGSTDYRGSIYVNNELVSSGSEGCDYTLIPNYDFSISLSVSGRQGSVYITIPEIDITENGTYEVGEYGYANVNVATTHTVTISSNMDATSGYVKYNGTNHYASATPFTISVNDGDSISLSLYYGNNNYLYVNDVHIAGGSQQAVSYTYAVVSDIEIHFSCASTSSEVYITDSSSHIATITSTGNSSYCYATYKETKYYTSGDTFVFHAGDTATLSAVGTVNAGYIYINDEEVYHGSGSYTYTLPDGDIELQMSYGSTSRLYVTELSDIEALIVTQNGTYTASGSTRGYSPVTVNVSGGSGGFTADQIAMQTISGSISGNATSIGSYAFYLCTSLTTVNFPSCTYIGSYAFVSCNNLTTISFPSCTSIGNYAFGYCSKLTTVNFPSCTYIGNGALTSCYNLTTASFPLCTSIGASAFISCTSLTTVNFPSCTYIGTSAFRSCYNLLSVYLLGSSIPTLTTNAFSNTPITGRTTSTGGVYGSIFVPSSLYNSYLTATNWSALSDRIVSM